MSSQRRDDGFAGRRGDEFRECSAVCSRLMEMFVDMFLSSSHSRIVRHMLKHGGYLRTDIGEKEKEIRHAMTTSSKSIYGADTPPPPAPNLQGVIEFISGIRQQWEVNFAKSDAVLKMEPPRSLVITVVHPPPITDEVILGASFGGIDEERRTTLKDAILNNTLNALDIGEFDDIGDLPKLLLFDPTLKYPRRSVSVCDITGESFSCYVEQIDVVSKNEVRVVGSSSVDTSVVCRNVNVDEETLRMLQALALWDTSFKKYKVNAPRLMKMLSNHTIPSREDRRRSILGILDDAKGTAKLEDVRKHVQQLVERGVIKEEVATTNKLYYIDCFDFFRNVLRCVDSIRRKPNECKDKFKDSLVCPLQLKANYFLQRRKMQEDVITVLEASKKFSSEELYDLRMHESYEPTLKSAAGGTTTCVWCGREMVSYLDSQFSPEHERFTRALRASQELDRLLMCSGLDALFREVVTSIVNGLQLPDYLPLKFMSPSILGVLARRHATGKMLADRARDKAMQANLLRALARSSSFPVHAASEGWTEVTNDRLLQIITQRVGEREKEEENSEESGPWIRCVDAEGQSMRGHRAPSRADALEVPPQLRADLRGGQALALVWRREQQQQQQQQQLCTAKPVEVRRTTTGTVIFRLNITIDDNDREAVYMLLSCSSCSSCSSFPIALEQLETGAAYFASKEDVDTDTLYAVSHVCTADDSQRVADAGFGTVVRIMPPDHQLFKSRPSRPLKSNPAGDKQFYCQNASPVLDTDRTFNASTKGRYLARPCAPLDLCDEAKPPDSGFFRAEDMAQRDGEILYKGRSVELVLLDRHVNPFSGERDLLSLPLNTHPKIVLRKQGVKCTLQLNRSLPAVSLPKKTVVSPADFMRRRREPQREVGPSGSFDVFRVGAFHRQRVTMFDAMEHCMKHRCVGGGRFGRYTKNVYERYERYERSNQLPKKQGATKKPPTKKKRKRSGEGNPNSHMKGNSFFDLFDEG